VARNRARRQVREFIRRHRPCWPAGIDFVVNLKPAAAQAATADLHRDLAYVFRKLGYDTAAEPVSQAHAEAPPAVITIPAEPHV
jgi:RNase P protein component